jgi:hypothetical protein
MDAARSASTWQLIPIRAQEKRAGKEGTKMKVRFVTRRSGLLRRALVALAALAAAGVLAAGCGGNGSGGGESTAVAAPPRPADPPVWPP